MTTLFTLIISAHAQWTTGDCRKQISSLEALKAMNQGTTVYSCKQMTFKPTRQGIKIVGKK